MIEPAGVVAEKGSIKSVAGALVGRGGGEDGVDWDGFEEGSEKGFEAFLSCC